MAQVLLLKQSIFVPNGSGRSKWTKKAPIDENYTIFRLIILDIDNPIMKKFTTRSLLCGMLAEMHFWNINMAAFYKKYQKNMSKFHEKLTHLATFLP